MDALTPELKGVIDSFIPYHEFHKEKYKSVLKSIVRRGGKFCRDCILMGRINVIPSTRVYSILEKHWYLTTENTKKNEYYRMAECMCIKHLKEGHDIVIGGMEKTSIEILEILSGLSLHTKCVFPQIHGCGHRTEEYILSLQVEDALWSDYSFFESDSE